jgi:5-methylcytosine-specific restriction enzyme A
MGKLRTLAPRLRTLEPRLSAGPVSERDRTRMRRELFPWRKWYATSRWQKLRIQVLTRDSFTCRLCGKLEGNTALLVADHRIPHKGDAVLFWAPDNLQCLCQVCHNSVKQSVERGGRGLLKRAIDVSGWPVG